MKQDDTVLMGCVRLILLSLHRGVLPVQASAAARPEDARSLRLFDNVPLADQMYAPVVDLISAARLLLSMSENPRAEDARRVLSVEVENDKDMVLFANGWRNNVERALEILGGDQSVKLLRQGERLPHEGE